MKLHIGVNSKTRLAHSAVVTAANVHDKYPLPQLLHGHPRAVAYRVRGRSNRIRAAAGLGGHPGTPPCPFDGKRMIFGGFEQVVEVKA
jgi:hypothetical protein